MSNEPLIFCALDTANLDTALHLAREVGAVTGGLKLGLEFVNSFGPQGIEKIKKACPDVALFIDLKFHDIPNTVAAAVKTVSEQFQPAFLNVHASGGIEMMQAAKQACASQTKLLGVTVLTSLESSDDSVVNLAKIVQKAGLDGVVCSGHEIEALRTACGPDFTLMVPGIRPESANTDDQKRVMTPMQALQKGANHLVIGRPITKAPDPAKAAREILEEIS